MPRIAPLLVASAAALAPPTPSTRPALYFPGGGLYYWWQAGVVERLQRSDHDGPVCGASAGALAATLYKCGVDMDAARDLALELSTPLLDRGALGLIGRWGPVVRRSRLRKRNSLSTVWSTARRPTGAAAGRASPSVYLTCLPWSSPSSSRMRLTMARRPGAMCCRHPHRGSRGRHGNGDRARRSLRGR